MVAGTAAAQDGDIVVDGNNATVTVVYAPEGIRSGSGSPGARPVWPYTCTWGTPWTGGGEIVVERTTNPIPFHRYYLTCIPKDPDAGLATIAEFVVYDPGDPVPGVPDVETSITIREVARNLVTPTVLGVGLSPQDRQVTGLDTWLWPVGDTGNVRASATAGGLTVTVEARYQRTLFDMGPEDGVVPCDQQVIWQPGASETPCSHTYLTEGSRTIQAISEWDFVWWDDAAQTTPVFLETVALVEAFDVEVMDLEAVIASR